MSVTIAAATIPNWQRDGDVVLRVYALTSFVAADGTEIVAGNSSADSSTSCNWFESVVCTIASGALSIPSITLPSTTDSPDNPKAAYTAAFFTSEGDFIAPYGQFTHFILFPTPPNTTWAAIATLKGVLTGTSSAPGFFWAGAWSVTKAYSILNMTSFGDSAWIAVAASVGETPGTGTSWARMVQGQPGPVGPQGEVSLGQMAAVISPTLAYTATVGQTGVAHTDNSANAPYILTMPLPFTGPLPSVTFGLFAASSDPLTILVAEKNADGTVSIVNHFAVTPAATTAVQTLDLSAVTGQKGQYVGFWPNGGGSRVAFQETNPATGPGYLAYAGGADFIATPQVWGPAVTTGTFDFSVALELAPQVSDETAALNAGLLTAIDARVPLSPAVVTSAQIAAILSPTFPLTATVGQTGVAHTDNSANAPYILTMPLPFTGPLPSVTFGLFAASSDPLTILVAEKNADGTVSIVNHFAVTPAATTAVQTLDLSAVTGQKGQYVGFWPNGGGSRVAFQETNPATGPGYLAYAGGADFIATPQVWGPAVTTGTFDFSVALELAPQVSDETNALNAGFLGTVTGLIDARTENAPAVLIDTSKTILLDEHFAGTALPAGWTASSGSVWTVNDGLRTPPSSGNPAYLQLGTYYGTTKRTHTLQFEVLAFGAFGFGSLKAPSENGSGIQSFFLTDGTNLIIAEGNYWVGAFAPVLVSVPLVGGPLVVGQTYTLAVSMNEREFTATLTGNGFQTTAFYGNNATDAGFVAPPGAMVDYPAIWTANGQGIVQRFTIQSDRSNPEIMAAGDSITWGTNINPNLRWANLVGAQTDARYVVSGRPGGTSTGLLGRMNSELQFLRPSFVIFLIGANDAQLGVTTSAFIANVQAAVNAARSFGAQVIVGYCTPFANNGGVQAALNGYNAALPSLTGVLGFVRFDLAMSTGDGMTGNPNYYGSDGVHPNAAGSVVMAARVIQDAPYLSPHALSLLIGSGGGGGSQGPQASLALLDSSDNTIVWNLTIKDGQPVATLSTGGTSGAVTFLPFLDSSDGSVWNLTINAGQPVATR